MDRRRRQDIASCVDLSARLRRPGRTLQRVVNLRDRVCAGAVSLRLGSVPPPLVRSRLTEGGRESSTPSTPLVCYLDMPDGGEHWARVKEVLNLALEARPDERPNIVRQACNGDSTLESDVESLLAYSSQTGKLDLCLQKSVRSFDAASEAPSQIGPYRVERELGSGGMGTVYLGVRDDDELPTRVALKVIQSGTSEALAERFRRERRILAGLIHPYIARLLDAGKLDDGRPYFVMEYVDGQTIDEYVALHRPAVLELFLKVCSAVEF